MGGMSIIAQTALSQPSNLKSALCAANTIECSAGQKK
jgi:hypothetical protein